MKINIETIPHEQQRYPTVGDWWTEPDGTIQIRVSALGNDDYELLVALHELVEQRLCRNRGITQAAVDAFDIQFEKDRAAGKYGENWEPGDDSKSPYRKEHFFATNLERMLALELGVDWRAYEESIYELP